MSCTVVITGPTLRTVRGLLVTFNNGLQSYGCVVTERANDQITVTLPDNWTGPVTAPEFISLLGMPS